MYSISFIIFMIQKKLDKLISAPQVPLRRVLRDLYGNAEQICLVCGPRQKLLGVVTITDIKQALMKGIDPQAPIHEVMNIKFISAPQNISNAKLTRLAALPSPYGTGPIGKIPLLDEEGSVTSLYISPKLKESPQVTVMVTGGAGYLGSIVCRMLLKKGYRVIALDKLLFGKEGIRELLKNKNFTLIEGDIADIGTLVQAVPGVDSVIHLAGIVGDPASSLNPLQTMEENHFATKVLVDICAHYQVSRFVFASSCSVYGASPDVLDETSKLNPVSLYARSKLYSEREILKAGSKEFHPVIMRFGTLYGVSPRMRFDLVVNIMTANGYFNKKVMVDGGAQWRPLVHVTDAARACIAAMEAPLSVAAGHIFNVGDTDENYRIEDIARAVTKSIPGVALDMRDTVKDRRDYRVTFSKIQKLLGFKAQYTLAKGIRELTAQMKKGHFKDWNQKKYSNYLTLKNNLEVL